MKKPNLQLLVTIFAICILAFSCDKKDDGLIENNGLSRDINDFVPKAILDTLESVGMPINTGGNPPKIDGNYIISPLILSNSNREDDVIGTEYTDNYLTLTDQNNKELTITVTSEYGSNLGSGEATGGYIVGNGTSFSIFVELLRERESGSKTLLAEIYSGNITSDGIDECYYCLVMINDYGDPNDEYIEIGDARVFYDGDGLAEKFDETKSIFIKQNIDKLKIKSAIDR